MSSIILFALFVFLPLCRPTTPTSLYSCFVFSLQTYNSYLTVLLFCFLSTDLQLLPHCTPVLFSLYRPTTSTSLYSCFVFSLQTYNSYLTVLLFCFLSTDLQLLPHCTLVLFSLYRPTTPTSLYSSSQRPGSVTPTKGIGSGPGSGNSVGASRQRRLPTTPRTPTGQGSHTFR